MNQSHLDSVHLDPIRRQSFRRAREGLLADRGPTTIALEDLGDAFGVPGSNTFIRKGSDATPATSSLCLMDEEGIYPLKVGVNTVGRLPDNDVVLPIPYISRRHCAILVHAAKKCEIHDIASKNGTFVNGHRVSGPTTLAHGDRIQMCDHLYTFLSESEPGAAEAASPKTLSF